MKKSYISLYVYFAFMEISPKYLLLIKKHPVLNIQGVSEI